MDKETEISKKLTEIEKLLKEHIEAVKKLTEEQFQDLIVVSYNEIDSNVELQSIGMVTV